MKVKGLRIAALMAVMLTVACSAGWCIDPTTPAELATQITATATTNLYPVLVPVGGFAIICFAIAMAYRWIKRSMRAA